MGIRVHVGRVRGSLALVALLASGAVLGGCSTSIADFPGTADATAAHKEGIGYLPVHDLPPDRGEAPMKPAEQAKIEAALIAARNRQASSAAQNTGK
jgi:hypothetical protein